jgi:hypothetical protein
MRTTVAPPPLSSEDQAAVDAVIGTLVHHLRQAHPPYRLPARRDAHPKHHGCLAAVFEVDADLPEELRQGLFASPGKYEAWVRFSNAFKMRHDLDRDARGMAIKVMGLDGVDHGEAVTFAGTQDFLLVTHKAFFARTPSDFVDFPAAVAGAGSPGALITRVLGFFFGWRPFRFKWRGHVALHRSLNWSTSPLVRTYFSQTPYRFGRFEAKFRARPQQRGWPHQWLTLWFRVSLYQLSWLHRFKFNRWKDLLQTSLLDFLRTREAVFDFEVQLRKDDMPLDDAVVVWSSWRSPYRRVATIRVTRLPEMTGDREADFLRTMMAFGEHLSFTPWHNLAEHEPLGSINAARRAVYEAIASLRHGLNSVRRREPQPGESPADYLRDIQPTPHHSGE